MPAEHNELVEEMQDIEKLPTVERLKLARKRRLQQLKKYAEYEKKLEKLEKSSSKKGVNAKGSSSSSSSGAPAGVVGAPPSPRPPSGRERATRRLVFADSIVFLDAASRNDIEEVRLLLERGVDPNVANDDGLTALHQCAIDDGIEMAALLLEYGANVNALDSEMWTPLHAAATCGHIRVCQQLVQSGANLLAVNADGNMPYDICEDEATLEFVETEMANMGVTQELIDRTRLCHSETMLADMEYICETGGDLEAKDKNGVVPLHIAAANGYYNVVLYLLNKGVAVDPPDSDGWTPLHAAACWGQMAIVDLLGRFGADLEAKTQRGETVLDICEDPELKRQIEEIKRALLSDKERQKDFFVQRRPSTHNTRGASIRRHSMRDRHRLSLKEAKEEALIFGADKDDGSVVSPDDVDVESALGGEGRDVASDRILLPDVTDSVENRTVVTPQEVAPREATAPMANASADSMAAAVGDYGQSASNGTNRPAADLGPHEAGTANHQHQRGGVGSGEHEVSTAATTATSLQLQPQRENRPAPSASAGGDDAPAPQLPKSALAAKSYPAHAASAEDVGKRDRSKHCCAIV